VVAPALSALGICDGRVKTLIVFCIGIAFIVDILFVVFRVILWFVFRFVVSWS
jgi:hypothetical protein